MPKYNVPLRRYKNTTKLHDSLVVSWRLPLDMNNDLKLIASEKGCTVADLVRLICDQYLQYEFNKKAKLGDN
jgi:hypothetical protein